MMDKAKMKKILLMALPLAAVAVAISPGSVKVYSADSVANYAYLDAVEGPVQGICAPSAAILNYVTFALVVIWLVRKKQGWLKGILAVSLLSACIAVLPVLIRTADVLIVPHFLFPLFTTIEAFLAYSMVRKPAGTEQNGNSQRLKVH